jgi:LysM repeat protein
MGQLEKYGLYVLCLVIFLILGVAIWGGEPQASGGGQPLALAGEKVAHKDASRGPAVSTPDDVLPLFGKAELPKPPAKEADKLAAKDDKGGDKEGKAAEKGRDAGKAKAEGSADAGQTRYRIKHGDTLEEIAAAHHTHVADIKKLNPSLDDRHLKIDSEILLPGKEPASTSTATKKDGKDAGSAKDAAKDSGKDAGKGEGWTWYTVRHGDTYEGISKSQFHDVHHVDAIKRLNPTLDPNRIRAGMEIRVPAK